MESKSFIVIYVPQTNMIVSNMNIFRKNCKRSWHFYVSLALIFDSKVTLAIRNIFYHLHTIGNRPKISHGMRFPTMWYFDMNMLSLLLSLETPNDVQSVA